MKRLLFATLMLSLALLPALALAQGDDCAALVDTAISTTAAECAGLAPGEACVGYAGVNAQFNVEDAPVFAAFGDTAPLNTICSLDLSAAADEWGVALLNVQTSDTGDVVRYAAFGDVDIQNVCSASFAVDVRVDIAADVHSGPGSHYDIIGSLPVGEVLPANACNCTGNWLRVVLDAETNTAGWVPARRVTMLGEPQELPVVDQHTPVYQPMQAFHFSSHADATCSAAPAGGILIQSAADGTPAALQINEAEVVLSGTLYAQSQTGGQMTLTVLHGVAQITALDTVMTVPAGARFITGIADDNSPSGTLRVEPFGEADVANLPIALLPDAIDPHAALDEAIPQIVGQGDCNVISDRGDTHCPLYFINRDGDSLAQMSVEFVYASIGEWEGSVRESPTLLSGNTVSGALDWNVSCSLAGENFIGPVEWSITITDETGHVSPAFSAQFSCIDG